VGSWMLLPEESCGIAGRGRVQGRASAQGSRGARRTTWSWFLAPFDVAWRGPMRQQSVDTALLMASIREATATAYAVGQVASPYLPEMKGAEATWALLFPGS